LIGTGQLDRDLDNESAHYKKRAAAARKIDAYRPLIEARSQEYPLLGAVRIHQEIRAAGHIGGYTQLSE
jgi:hypothetical protein